MEDSCLERSRRWAWRRYYEQRDNADRLAWWGAEAAEWLDALADDIPPEAASLIELLRAELDAGQLAHVRRFVRRALRRTRAS